MIKCLADIINNIEKSADPVRALQENDDPTLREILTYSLHPDVQWKLPDTDPPYNSVAENTDIEGKLYGDIKLLKYFVNTPEGLAMTQPRREQMFIRVLESVDAKDAKLLLRMKNKAINISVADVTKAFPDLTKSWSKS